MEYKIIKGADGRKYVVFASSRFLDKYLTALRIDIKRYSFMGFNNAIRLDDIDRLI